MKKEQKTLTSDSMAIFLQKQPRDLTLTKQSFDMHQMRVLGRVIEQLQPKEVGEGIYLKEPIKDDLVISIKAGDLVVAKNYTFLKRALKGLLRTVVELRTPLKNGSVNIYGTTLIRDFEYNNRSTDVSITIAKQVLPLFIDYSKGYTQYMLDVAFKTSSPYVYKMYQYICMFRDKDFINCNVSTLRKYLNLEDKYSMPSRIKERILIPAIKELKDVDADVQFEIAGRNMKGREMIGWKFKIIAKPQAKAVNKSQNLPPSTPKSPFSPKKTTGYLAPKNILVGKFTDGKVKRINPLKNIKPTQND